MPHGCFVVRVKHQSVYATRTLVLWIVLVESSSQAAFSGESPRQLPSAIHPDVRHVADPAGGESVTVNPPPLLWPVVSGRDVRYNVRLSQDAHFSDKSTISAEGLRWAMFNAHRPLSTGTWYWQYAVIRNSREKPKWSSLLRFDVPRSARVFTTPAAAQMLEACPAQHPRILISAADLPAARAQWKGTAEWDRAASSARRYLGQSLPDVSAAKPHEKGKNAFESKNFAKWASKGYAAKLLGPVKLLVHAYLVTGDERFGREAVRRGLFVAELDPNGVTARSVSDFADGSCMEAMALVYDTCYNLLSDVDRSKVRAAMIARAGRLFGRCFNSLEARVFSAHIWQHILFQGTAVAFALLGETPEADLWIRYVYELWIARFPLLGGNDGGWANGLNYFGTNFHTLQAVPSLFGRLTGVNFFDHPWYRNAPYFQIYCWPPGSASDGFGDGGERESAPSSSRGEFVLALAEQFHDPYALWYAQQVLGNKWDDQDTDVATLPPKPPDDLAQSRIFRDIGVVSMHRHLTQTPRDLMIGFRSSPYGSYNHMHSDQNSVNILCGGQRLFSNSGYYIAYGDAHFKDWYTHTRGHNSVLIDGQGQVRSASGYGWIARYLHGRQITYCLGDASAAYGKTGLTKFRRHLAFLRPSTIVVYDELEADHAADWSWLLHSKNRMTTSGQRIVGSVSTAHAQVDLMGSSRLDVSVDNRFDPPAVNWRNKSSGGKKLEYPDQWHATVTPADRVPVMRYLALFQIRDAKDATPFDEPEPQADEWIRLANWRIRAELIPKRPASLVIERQDGGAGLATDVGHFELGPQQYELTDDLAVLVERDSNIVVRCHDEKPRVNP